MARSTVGCVPPIAAKKLARMVKKAKNGGMTREKVDQSYECWKAHASHGNSYKLIARMDEYYKSLWRDDNDQDHKEGYSEP